MKALVLTLAVFLLAQPVAAQEGKGNDAVLAVVTVYGLTGLGGMVGHMLASPDTSHCETLPPFQERTDCRRKARGVPPDRFRTTWPTAEECETYWRLSPRIRHRCR